MVALRHVSAIIDIGRDVGLKVLGGEEAGNLGWIRGGRKSQGHGFCGIRIGIPPAARVEQPQPDAIAVRGRSAGRAIAFTPVYDVHAEDSFDRLFACGEGVVPDPRETDLVGRRITRLRSALPVAWVAERTHDPDRVAPLATGRLAFA